MYKRIIKSFKYIAYVIALLVLLLIGLIWWEESKVFDTGFVPTYDKEEELSALVEKATTSGLTPEEFKKMEILLEDKKRQTDEQVQDWLDSK